MSKKQFKPYTRVDVNSLLVIVDFVDLFACREEDFNSAFCTVLVFYNSWTNIEQNNNKTNKTESQSVQLIEWPNLPAMMIRPVDNWHR